jgi:hypothetical protein
VCQCLELCPHNPHRDSLGGRTDINNRGRVLGKVFTGSPAGGDDITDGGSVGGVRAVRIGEVAAYLLKYMPG